MILVRLPFASAIARGALFGVGAHGAGTARAHQIGETEGAVAERLCFWQLHHQPGHDVATAPTVMSFDGPSQTWRAI